MKTIIISVVATCLSLSLCVNAQNPAKKILQGTFGGKNKVKESDLPSSYKFDWKIITEVTSGSKKDKVDLNYLINSETEDFVGMEMSSKELKGGNATIVFDNKLGASVMFMEMQGQKMAQVNKIPKQTENEKEPDMAYKEIGTKEILGLTCYGIEIENKTHIGTMYFTLDAPVSFSAFFAMSNNKNLPKGFDPALLQVLKEDALLMEMTMNHKKKKKESMTITTKSIDQKDTELKKANFRFMRMGF